MKRRSVRALQDAGVFEGARKQGDYGEAKGTAVQHISMLLHG